MLFKSVPSFHAERDLLVRYLGTLLIPSSVSPLSRTSSRLPPESGSKTPFMGAFPFFPHPLRERTLHLCFQELEILLFLTFLTFGFHIKGEFSLINLFIHGIVLLFSLRVYSLP